MLDLRLMATLIALSIGLMSVASAEPTKDQAEPAVQSSREARPVRVILPAPWQPSERQAETQSAK
ncbi:hypothetical protein SAMN05216525_14942 [Bradyrhizobium sp. Gha]|nr:hypothetical protein SAMN05216525_14942 [Bradyrhizobium sp. Gha]